MFAATATPVVILPDGFAIPPLAYVVAVLAVTGAVTVLLFALRPPVTKGTILALTPWIVAGSALHVLHVLDAVEALVRPLFGTPTVYLTTYALAGGCWALLAAIGVGQKAERRIDRRLGAIGLGVAVAAVGFVLLLGLRSGTLNLYWALITIVATAVIWAIAWLAMSLAYTPVVAKTGVVGALVVLAHALDGVSTAIGVDFLGVHERSPIPRAIMDAAGSLPTADLVGVGWAFVAVKLLIAGAIVGLLAEYVEEAPSEGWLLLGFLAAIGLGPGVHNVLLLLVGG